MYVQDHVTAVKEKSYDAYGDIPLEEHWLWLIKDQKVLYTPFQHKNTKFSNLRKSIVEWIFHLGDKLKQRSLTLQLAIVYIDKLFQKNQNILKESNKHLWGLTALYLASKYDELDENIPFIKDFRSASSKAKFTWTQVTKCEDSFVKLLEWNLMVVCPLNYTYALLTFGVVFTDDEVKYKLSQYANKNLDQGGDSNRDTPDVLAHKLKSVRKYCEFFTDMAIQSLDIQQYEYSVQALAAVVAARRICGIKPIWSRHFEDITGYDYTQIEECYNKLYSKYEKFFSKSKVNLKKENAGNKENRIKKLNFMSKFVNY